MMLFSVTGAIFSFYGYTLSKVEGRYIRRSGLFTKHEVSNLQFSYYSKKDCARCGP